MTGFVQYTGSGLNRRTSFRDGCNHFPPSLINDILLYIINFVPKILIVLCKVPPKPIVFGKKVSL